MRSSTTPTTSMTPARRIVRAARPIASLRLFALLVAAALLLPTSAAFAKEGQRFGLEGRFIEFDQAKSVIKVKVVKTKVSGGAGTGAVAGKPAPKSIRPGQDIDFAVVPEGSVLKRTVIKNLQGGGLDTTGTMEGFLKALSLVPTDKNVIFSFEKAKTKGGAEWDLRIIQLRMTEEEQEARLKKLEAAAAEADAKAAGAGK
jgi:hypothetical protein